MPTDARTQKVTEVVSARQEGIVVLEDIHDPHNAQAVIRTCDSLGFQTMYLIFENERQFNPTKFGKLSSSSANKWVDYKFFNSTQECFDELKALGYKTYATTLSSQSQSIFDIDFTQKKKIALAFGNEQTGLSEKAISLSDYHLKIPMSGMVQSLNLSVTAAICLFELSRQRQSAGMDNFILENSIQSKLIESFFKRT